MSARTLQLDPAMHAYLIDHGVRETDTARSLRRRTSDRADANMQISPEQGAFLAFLLKVIGASTVVEVGTFTGYSALWMAGALPEHGTLLACDIDPVVTEIARQAWAEAGLSSRITLRIGPAADTLQALLDDGAAGSVDLMFIDADKTGYPAYVNLAHQLLRDGGVAALDNVLWGGSVADDANTKTDTVALRALNTALRHDDRWDLSMVPIGDGLTLLRKR